MNWLLIGFGFIIMIVAGLRIAAYRRMRGVALRSPVISLAAAEELPEGLRRELEDGLAALLPLGFQARGFTRIRPGDADDDRPLWCGLAEQAQHATWVQVYPNALPEPEVPLRACFLTPLADGRLLISTPGQAHLWPAFYAGAIHVDHGELELAAAGTRHFRELTRHQVGAPLPDAAAFLACHQALDAGFLPLLRARGLMVPPAADGRERLTGKAAWSWIGRAQRGQSVQVRALLALRKRQGGARGTVPIAIEADAVLRHEQAGERRIVGGSSWLLFAFTLVAFIATARLTIGDSIPVSLIIAILLFHESGHFLAMRACGYRDTRIFFLPLFGAAATGRKRDATIPQQVLVSLMGPLPGIVLGLALLTCAPSNRHDPLFQAGMMLVAINLFNLLPVLPLDGGQILSRVLFARRPWLDLVFRALAAVAMVALGLATSPILIYLGAFLAFGLVHQRQIARLRSRIMGDPALDGLADERLTEAVSALVAQDPLVGRWQFLNRLRLVRDVVAALNQPRITTGTRVALLGVYVGALLLTPAALIAWRVLNR